MLHRFFLLSTLLSNLVISNAYAETIEIRSTPDHGQTASVVAENDVASTATAMPEQQQAATVTAQPHHGSINANLHLQQQGQRLYAYIVIEQAQAKDGKVRVDWTPPPHSSCDKSSYVLSYAGKKFHTQAYRTLGYGLINGKSISCTGTWQADVKNAQGVKLTTATIHIESVDAYANAKMRSLAAIA